MVVEKRRTDVAKEFNVSGRWTLSQGNGWHATFNIEQPNEGSTENRRIIRGTAFASHPTVSETMYGSGDGQVDLGSGAAGNQFVFTVPWGGANPIQARYTGTFGFDRRITRFNHATASPSVQTTRVSDKAFNIFPPL